MKNTIKTFALFLTAGAMLASCDSYLDRQPDEPLTSDNIFKKQKTTLQYLTNIYSYQPDYEAPACVSNSNDIPWEACSDETSFAYLDRSYTQINYNSWNPSLHIYRDDTYNTPYKGIREANYFMQNVHKCPPEELNDVDKGYYYNEARFLRAHFYAMMLPVYGPVFLIGDDPVDFTQSGLDQRERNTWDECVNYVANELWEAAKGLPDSWPDIYYGRATKGAALAARARLLLYSARKLFNGNELYKGIVNKNGDHLFPTQYDEKKWELAAQAAKDVMNLNLYSLVGADGTDPYASFNTLFTSVGSGTGGATEKIYTRIASGYQWRVVTPECRRNGLRRLRRNPETGRRVRHGQRPLPHHGLHRRRPGAADHRPRRRLQRKRILEVQAPDLRRRTGDVQNVPEPRTALLRQRVLERHDLARSQQENSQRPVLFQRQFGSGKIAQLSADGLSGA
jgi:hypothetical protein